MRLSSSKRGFTLVEMSVVLVVIGLLIGGIMIGKDMIHTAELRSVLNDIANIEIAANTFKAKYDCLPGDCKNATSVLTDGNIYNGNGNGKIGSFVYDGNYLEATQFYYQLWKANLFRGPYTATASAGRFSMAPGVYIPAVKHNPKVGYLLMYFDGMSDPGNDWNYPIRNYFHTHFLMIGKQDGSFETYRAGFTPADAFYIDTKLDDGKPGLGLLTHFFVGQDTNCATSKVNATAVYRLTYTGLACGIAYYDIIPGSLL